MDERNAEVIRLTQQLVQIDSCNPGPQETRMGDFVYHWFEQAGIPVVRDEVFPGRYNIVAKLQGEIDDPALVFICHMDTVPFGDEWTREPLDGAVEGDRLWGRGSSDMKSGLAAAMMAFRNIAQSGKELKHSFVCVASVDEEVGMAGAEHAIASGYITPNSWVLDAEPTDGCVKMAHKGKHWFKLTTHGLAAHASMPAAGIDAIGAMAEIISAIRARIAKLPVHPTMGACSATFGLIDGGSCFNAVSDHCSLGVDTRLVPPVTLEQNLKLMEDAIAEGLAKVPGATCDLEVTEHRPFVDLNENSVLFQQMVQAHREVTGEQAKVDFFPGYTDSAVAAASLGNHNCVSYGPGIMGVTHKPDEYVRCSDVIRVERVLTRAAERLLLD